MKSSRNALSPGHQIHWYVISRILGQGGFGITYLAEDSNLGRNVAIKEYLPSGMAVREGDASVHPVTGEQGEQYHWGLDRFISEAQTLARFKHSNIVHVYSVFSENNTAYMVMEYEKGHGLEQILKEKKVIPEAEIKSILMPLLDGLEQVHAFGFIHRDIKPANIFIRENGTPVLLDFGSARQSLGEHTQTLTAMVSPGFAPFEQYTSKGDKQGPWTDIYGLGATLYRAVIGRSPANAMDRSEALLQTSRDIYVPAREINPDGYSPALINAIDAALKFKTTDRPQSISEWRNIILDNSRESATTIAVNPDVLAQTEKIESVKPTPTAVNIDENYIEPQKGSRTGWRAVTLTLVVLVVILIISRTINRTGPVNTAELPQQTVETQGVDSAGAQPGENIDLQAPLISVEDESISVDMIDISETLSDELINQPDSPVTRDSDQAASQTSQPVRPIELIQQRLKENPGDPEATRELRALLTQYERRIRTAIRTKNYDQAERYVEEMLRVAPNNQRLQESLAKIRSMQRDR